MKVAVIGCGHWGKNHVRSFARLGALDSVCDPNAALARSLADEYGAVACGFDEALARPINGVVLATPATTHADLAIRAFAAGKHVLVEKPLAMSVAEAEAVLQAAEAAGKRLMVGHLLHYHPAFVAAKRLVHEDQLGQLRHIHSTRRSFGKVRAEEDVVWSFAPHDISMVLALAQAEPTTVQCVARSFLQQGIADNAALHLDFANGISAQILVSWADPAKEQRLVAVGTEGMLVFDDTKPWSEKLVLHKHGFDLTTQPPGLRRADPTPVPLQEGEPLLNECQHFLNLMAGTAPDITDGPEALAVLSVLERASAPVSAGS
jgi:UDP-2-acetamido-3-amino-2,3-dideoxy-glucuronate N-acetyltransferase